MKANKISTGKIIEGKEVYALELTNMHGTYVKIYNYGGIISQFVVKNAIGEKQDILLGFDNFEDYLSEDYLKEYPYLGTIIGRYSNRIKDGRFTIDNESYQLEKNLHGGLAGFDKKVWDILPTIDPSLTLQYISPAGEEGFPGNLTVQLTIKLTEEDELLLTYHATTDATTALNLTHHSYFNLAVDKGNIAGHHHRMPASHYLQQDNDFVAIGGILPVAHTNHDFRAGKLIGQDWNSTEGYDQSYVLDKPYGELGLASETIDETSGLKLEIYTTEPIAHFYTAKHLKVAGGKDGKDYGEFDAFCVETQHYPNSVNVPEFPSTLLHPGESYNQTTIFKVSTI